MADDVGVLYVKVTADTTELINKTQADAMAAGKKSSAAFGKKFAAGMAIAGAAVGAAAVGITKSVVDLGREYEDNMLKVQAVTGATAEAMEVASQAAKDLGNDVTLPGVSAAGAADAMLQLAKAGFSVEEAAAAADGAMRLAVSAQMDVGQAAEIAANAVGAFGLNASDATMVADLLAKGSTSAATTVAELGVGMAQASANFAAAGVPIQDMVTSMGLMANAGVKGSDAGTSLKTMLQKLTAPTKQSAKAMKDLGVNVFDAQGNLKPMRDLVEDFSKATAGMTEEQRAAAITTIFGADASRAANIVLTQGVEKYDELAGAMNNAEGAAADLAGATTQGLSGAIEAIQSQLETVAIDIYEQIAPSLTEVFRGIGDVVETLAPVLSSVGATLGNVAGTVLQSLSQAFASLLPALQPILDIFAKLGEKLGPLVGKVLGKLAELLGELFAAVGPVLDVLIDLVFEVLDAAWPIIEVVVDVFIALVRALAPVLIAVTKLLPAFTLLINTALKIILPILEPLLPVIEALAALFGDLMVRQIGAMMFALGKLLRVLGDISPFIRDNVVKPIIKFWTQWAKTIVQGADLAFGWIPGLDGKLERAVGAIDQFAKDAEDAVHQAFVETAADAKAMGDELAGVGEDLMLNGAASAGMYDAGKNLGSNLGQGMVAGMQSQGAGVAYEAKKMSMQAISSSKETLQTRSPSRVFIEIGQNVVDGFVKGMEDGNIEEPVREKFRKGVQGAIDELNNLQVEAKRVLDASIKDFEDYALNVQKALMGDAANPAIAMQETKNQANEVIRAQERLNELRARQANQKELTDNDRQQLATAEADLAAAQAAAKSFEENFQAQIDLSMAFTQAMQNVAPVIAGQFDMSTPEGRAMYDAMIANITGAGPEIGLATAEAISSGLLSPTAFQSLSELNVFAGQVGREVAEKSKGEGVRNAHAVVVGLRKQMKAEKKELMSIGALAADGMTAGFRSKLEAWKAAVREYVRATKAELDIRSPSRVFAEIGEQTAAGFNQGFTNNVDTPIGVPAAPKTRSFSVTESSLDSSGGDTSVRVFIGDRELTDIVDVQIDKNQNDMARSLMLGRY